MYTVHVYIYCICIHVYQTYIKHVIATFHIFLPVGESSTGQKDIYCTAAGRLCCQQSHLTGRGIGGSHEYSYGH